MKESVRVYHFSFTIVVHTGETQDSNNISVRIGPAESHELAKFTTIERVSFTINFLGHGSYTKSYQMENDNRFKGNVFTAIVDVDWATASRKKTISEGVEGEHLIEAYIKGYLTALHGEAAREAFADAV